MKFGKIMMIAAVSMCSLMLSVYPVQAEDTQEILPLEEINIQEDSDWSEDGETQFIRQEKEKEAPFSFRVQTYLSSGVDSVVYAATEVQGVDVSHHQGSINWGSVKASGMKFAMIRVGYRGYGTGAICADSYFETNIKNALAAGMKVGIYFFSQALNEQEAYEEACYTINMMKKYNITYPVAFDWETASGYRTYNAQLSSSQMNAIASKFCDTVKNAGYIPIVYSNTVDFTGRYNFSDLSSKYYIWYARYLPEFGGTTWYKHGDRLPNYNNNIKFNIWQYMSDGTVPGISGNCDVNVSFLDFGTLRENPQPVVKEVTLTTSSKDIQINTGEKQITGVAAGNTYSGLRSCFENFYISINGSGNGSGGSNQLKTGDTLVFTPKDVYSHLKDNTYVLVIKGDVDGNGTIDVHDMEGLQKDLLGIEKLADANQVAAELDGDDELTVKDIEVIQKYLLGMGELPIK